MTGADERGGWWPQVAIVFVTFLAVGLPPLLGGQPMFMRDLGRWHAPVLEAVHSGGTGAAVPLWTSSMGAGRPILADSAYASLYPASLLYSVLPFPEAFNGYIVFHFLIAGLGMLLLARRCGLEPWAGVVAAEAYMLGGFTMSCAAQYPMIAGVALSPLVVAMGLAASRQPTPARVSSTAVLLALQILGGQPEPVLMSVALGVLWSLADGSERAWYRRVAPWFVACPCAIALAAPQVVPAWLYLKGTIRDWGYLPDAFLFWSLDPDRITWMILPGGGWDPLSRLSGSPSASLVDGGVPLFDSIYVGLCTWVLAGVAVVSAAARWRTSAEARTHRERIVLMASATAVLGVTAALGRHLVGVEWVLANLPVTLPIRYPVKTVMLTAVSLPLMSGFGAAALCRWTPPHLKRTVVLLATFAVVADLGLAHRAMLRVPGPGAVSAGRVLAEALHLAAKEAGAQPSQWRIYHHRTPQGVRGPRVPRATEMDRENTFRWDMAMLMPVSGMRHRLSHCLEGAVHNLEPKSMFMWARELHSTDHCRLVSGLGSMGVLWVVSHDPDLEAGTRGMVTRVGEIGENVGLPAPSAWVYRVERFLPRARVVTDWIVDPGGSFESLAQRMDAARWPPPPVLDRQPRISAPRPGSPDLAASVVIVSETSDSLVLETQSSEAAVLLVSDVLTAGWQATVNGGETQIMRANGSFRAVEIPPGLSTVRFSYRPPGLLAGVALAGSVLAGLVAACLTSRRQRPGRRCG